MNQNYIHHNERPLFLVLYAFIIIKD